ncbi:golgi nucleotide sugar transporter 4 [Actinidia rufa]|uniref:Golgi nucleotide sugar transporter 4 n=1 Tax=Actinidia rufa TaxID=165716 RepID=A0A7J0E329_9ERIC|nr:golgi nucleotide sugar transporter 4 [Actinidia rufa]
MPAAVVFYLAIFTNTNLLRHANVDTFIVFRSLTPLLVAIADTTFRNQPCPSKLTFMSLVIILGVLLAGARKAISATSFTVTGVVNKFLTVLINVMIWDKHAGPFGLVCLLLTIAGGVLYQQSVTGANAATSQRDSATLKQITGENDGDEYGDTG